MSRWTVPDAGSAAPVPLPPRVCMHARLLLGMSAVNLAKGAGVNAIQDRLAPVTCTARETLRRVDAAALERLSRAGRRLRVPEKALSLLREQGHILPESPLARVVNDV